MNLNPFQWLRAQARAYFLDGIADACEDLATGERLPERLQGRLTLALAAPAGEPEEVSKADGKVKRAAK